MHVRMTEKYYKQIEKELDFYFYDFYWKDILGAVKEAERFYNTNSALIAAIRKGSVHYESGKFTGKFNAAISRELRKFSKYDGRSKSWSGIPPSNVTAAAAVANSRGEQLAGRIKTLIDEIPARVEAAVENLKYSIDAPLFSVSTEAGKDLNTLGISVDMTPELSQRLMDDYTNNQNLNIKNWTPEQTGRLRAMIEQNALSGYNRLELQQLIASEYGTTMAKAKFLARQETSLFVAEVRNERYDDAGIKWYRWSTSMDIRVVGTPGGLYPEGGPGHGNHYVMQGKICKLNDPTVYADSLADARKGLWKSKASIGADNTHPGQAYNDRCVMIPVI